MSTHERKTLEALLPALDEDIDEMSDDDVQRELAAAGVDLKASTAAFKTFSAKALAAHRRRQLEAAEKAIAGRKPLDLFQKAVQLTLGLADDAIRKMIVDMGGMTPAHRERDGTAERELLIQTLADLMALKEQP